MPDTGKPDTIKNRSVICSSMAGRFFGGLCLAEIRGAGIPEALPKLFVQKEACGEEMA